MNKMFLLIFFLPLFSIHALEITEKQLETYIKGEYNRTFHYYGEIQIIGQLELNEMLNFRGGFSYGLSADNTDNTKIRDIKSFAKTGVTPFSKIPLDFSLYWIYNGLPDYEMNSQTILPLISFNHKRVGGSLGFNFRFTSFFGEPVILEINPIYSIHFHVYDGKTMRVSVITGTFSEFLSDNFFSYSLKINALVRLNSNWSILNEIEFLQSGSAAAAANFYGFSWLGGVRYSW